MVVGVPHLINFFVMMWWTVTLAAFRTGGRSFESNTGDGRTRLPADLAGWIYDQRISREHPSYTARHRSWHTPDCMSTNNQRAASSSQFACNHRLLIISLSEDGAPGLVGYIYKTHSWAQEHIITRRSHVNGHIVLYLRVPAAGYGITPCDYILADVRLLKSHPVMIWENARYGFLPDHNQHRLRCLIANA